MPASAIYLNNAGVDLGADLSRDGTFIPVANNSIIAEVAHLFDVGSYQTAWCLGSGGSEFAAYLRHNSADGQWALTEWSSDFVGTAVVTKVRYVLGWSILGTGASQLLGYKNGTIDITGNSTTITGTTFKIGEGVAASGERMGGWVRNVMIYTPALTAFEHKLQACNMHRPMFRTRLLAWYKLEHSRDYQDYSGNGRNLTPSGTIYTFSGTRDNPQKQRDGYPGVLTGSAGGGIVADLPPALVDFSPVAPGSSKVAAFGPAGVDFLGVAPGSAKSAAFGTGLVDFLGVAAAASKAASSGQGLVDITGVAATSAKFAAQPPAVVEITAPALVEDGGITAPVPPVVIDFSPVAPATTKAAASGIGLVDFLGVSPTSSKVAALPSGLVEFVGVSPGSTNLAALPPAAIDVLGVAPGTLKTAALDPARIEFFTATRIALALEGI